MKQERIPSHIKIFLPTMRDAFGYLLSSQSNIFPNLNGFWETADLWESHNKLVFYWERDMYIYKLMSTSVKHFPKNIE